MKRFYRQFRVVTLTLAFGLASVPFFNNLSYKWNVVSVDVPQVESESPIYVSPYEVPKPPTKEEIFQARDMTLYDLGKAFSNCAVPSSKYNKCKKEKIKAREFIWNHWKAKKRAYIAYEWTGADTGGDIHIFIEPDDKGRWFFALRSTGDLRFMLEIRETKAHLIKYKRATENAHWLEKGEWYLSLLDENGEEVNGF